MDTLVAEIRNALRVLWKSPGFTFVAVAALALGIGANTAIFSVVNGVLLKPLPFPDSQRIMRLGRSFKGGTGYATSIPKFMAWKQNDVFEAVAAYDFAGPGLNLGSGDRPEQVKAIHVSLDFFRVFGTGPMLGRAFVPEEDHPGGQRAAILSNGLWKSRFGGDLHFIGQIVKLNGDPYTVVGIMPAEFHSDPPADIWIPLQADPNSANQGHYLNIAGRLKPGVTVEQAKAQMKIVGEQFRKAYPKWMDKNEGVAVVPLQDSVVENIRPALLILLGAVGFVLLIACANVANLLLARAAGRHREIAIRTAIGASRFRIIRQLLTESVVLALIGGAAGLVLGAIGTHVLVALTPPNLPRISDDSGALSSFTVMDWRVLVFTIGLSLLTGLIFGLFPALQVARADVNSVLKEASSRGGTGRRQNRLRGLLVISEIALALVLLIGAALMIRTFVGLRNVDTGFDARNVITMQSSLAGVRYNSTVHVSNLTRQVLERIETLPGVQAAATTLLLPVEGSIDLPFVIQGRPTANGEQYHGDENWANVSPHYFSAFKIPLKRGRVFDESDVANSTPVAIVNEAMAKKYWPKEDPIGQRIAMGGKALGPEFDEPPRLIVGVVGTVRQNGLSRANQCVMYVPGTQVTDGLTRLANNVAPISWIVKTNSDPRLLTLAIEREILAVDGQMPVAKVRTMDQVIGDNVARQSFSMLLLSLFAGIALLLAAIGIYGLMSYSVEQRTHEIGIRMALGAGRGDMVGLVVGQGMLLAGTGVIVGLASAYGLTRLLASLLFGVSANDPVIFASVAAILCVVALLASYIPARRAMRVDPMVALRYE